MRTLSISTSTHGRVLVMTPVGVSRKRLPASLPPVVLVGFHGYAQNAEDMMDVLQRMPGSDECTLVSIQAMNRFYARGDQKVVANWMTRQDRDEAIADNITYVDRALGENGVGSCFETTPDPDLFFVGFSQGVAMAYRAGLMGKRPAAGVVAIGGDIAPDVQSVPADRWPRVMIAAGAKDQWYTPDKVAADETFLRAHGVNFDIHRSDAGHEVTDDMLAAVARFIANA
jgi:predicted esterase